MKLNVGDYVRTKNGLIFKIIGGNVDNWDLDISFGMLETFEDNWLELYRYNDNGSFFDNKNIVKSSPNIIDLIEVGDYVNGSKLLEVDYAEDEDGNCDKIHYQFYFEDDDKDINEYYEDLEVKYL